MDGVPLPEAAGIAGGKGVMILDISAEVSVDGVEPTSVIGGRMTREADVEGAACRDSGVSEAMVLVDRSDDAAAFVPLLLGTPFNSSFAAASALLLRILDVF